MLGKNESIYFFPGSDIPTWCYGSAEGVQLTFFFFSELTLKTKKSLLILQLHVPGLGSQS